jgi:hypothetical protein
MPKYRGKRNRSYGHKNRWKTFVQTTNINFIP